MGNVALGLGSVSLTERASDSLGRGPGAGRAQGLLGQCSQVWGLTSECPAWSRELGLVMSVDPFPLRIFYSVIL